MSRTTRLHFRPLLAVVGLFGLASLGAPAVSHAQDITPEQALLNSTPAPSFVVASDSRGSKSAIDGERALLGRSSRVPPVLSLAAGSPQKKIVDGEEALLGRGDELAR